MFPLLSPTRTIEQVLGAQVDSPSIRVFRRTCNVARQLPADLLVRCRNMNQRFLGDSFDLVKRFFCNSLVTLGYEVVIDPMFTDKWNDEETTFYKLVGARPAATAPIGSHLRALFIDPDTGIRKTEGRQHVSFDRMVAELQNHALVFAFDQAFSYKANPESVMREKLAAIRDRGCHGFYYNSHARFLFVSREAENLNVLTRSLCELGLPESRLLQVGT